MPLMSPKCSTSSLARSAAKTSKLNFYIILIAVSSGERERANCVRLKSIYHTNLPPKANSKGVFNAIIPHHFLSVTQANIQQQNTPVQRSQRDKVSRHSYLAASQPFTSSFYCIITFVRQQPWQQQQQQQHQREVFSTFSSRH